MTDSPSSLELSLGRRFAVRVEPFGHGEFRVQMLMPRAADELIDISDFNRDERLPYWADLWPSARALAAALLDGPAPTGRVLELGCGIALPSLALRARGVPVLATDYYPEALEFARVNAERNGLPPLETRLLDWRHPPPDLERFKLVVAADVLYEQRNGEALRALLPRIAAPGGQVLIADPGRIHAGEFLARMRDDGWAVEEVERREEPSPVGKSARITVRLLALSPPAA